MLAQGTIHGIQIARGLGFIRPDDGTADLLFHRGALAAGAFEELRAGQPVTFEVTSDPREPARRQVPHLRLLEE